MDDSEVNPTKTGLMFVPLGWATMSPGCLITSSQSLDRLENYKAAVNRGVHLLQLVSLPPRRPDAKTLVMQHDRIGEGSHVCCRSR